MNNILPVSSGDGVFQQPGLSVGSKKTPTDGRIEEVASQQMATNDSKQPSTLSGRVRKFGEFEPEDESGGPRKKPRIASPDSTELFDYSQMIQKEIQEGYFEQNWASFFLTALEGKRLDKAAIVYHNVKQCNIQVSVQTVNRLARACVELKCPDKATIVFEDVKSAKVPYNPLTFICLFKVFKETDQQDNAIEVIEAMKEKQLLPSQQLFRAFIKICTQKHQLEKAFTLFDEMKAIKFKPDQATINTLLEAACPVEDMLDRAYGFFEEYKQSFWCPFSSKALNKFFKACTEAKKLNHALAVLEKMRKHDFQVDSDTVQLYLAALIQSKTVK